MFGEILLIQKRFCLVFPLDRISLPFNMRVIRLVVFTEVFLTLLLEYGLGLKFRGFFPLPSNTVISQCLSLSGFFLRGEEVPLVIFVWYFTWLLGEAVLNLQPLSKKQIVGLSILKDGMEMQGEENQFSPCLKLSENADLDSLNTSAQHLVLISFIIKDL